MHIILTFIFETLFIYVKSGSGNHHDVAYVQKKPPKKDWTSQAKSKWLEHLKHWR